MHRKMPSGWVVLAVGVAAWAGPPAASAQEILDVERARTIRVTGVGTVQVQPDQARLMFAVETVAQTAQEAGQENARRMDRVIRALVEAGVPRSDIESQNYSLRPDYAHDEGRREPRIIGYRASNRVMVTTRDLPRVGRLIDVALGAGANRVEGVSFSTTEVEEARLEALRRAVAHARASAEAIAGALGARLGPVLDASTSGDPVRPRYEMREQDVAMLSAGAPPTPIEPGEQTVRASVSIIFRIE